MKLVPEFSYAAKLKPPVEVGAGPYGIRSYFEAIGGEVTGDRISGAVTIGGGDWVLIGADGWARMDVSVQFATADGANLYLTYGGLIEFNETVQQALASAGGTDWDDQYFRTSPRIETGDERYAWATQALFVGQGRFIEGLGVEYQVSRVD